jgi:hypothetical protein
MKVKGSLTMFFDKDGLRIEVEDDASSLTFVEIEVDPKAVCAAMGRLANVPCKMEYHGLERLGQKMEVDRISVPMPKEYDYVDRKQVAKIEVEKALEELDSGWVCSDNFNSRDSFYWEGNQEYASATIRRWVSAKYLHCAHCGVYFAERHEGDMYCSNDCEYEATK